MQKTIATFLLLVGAGSWIGAYAADKKAKATEIQNLPIATQTLLDGVRSPESKGVIKSVLMIQCPKDNGKGTGFVLSGGNVITTNAHVVGTCSAGDLIGISSVSDEPVKFATVEKDPGRDLALLCTTKPLPFSLELKGDENPQVETEVETWGYPLRYQDSAPVLSRGYVAGYTTKPGTSVKHLIVNGALNPGNSGGPLIDRANGKVIGIVVEKWRLFSPDIEAVISGLQRPKTATLGGLQVTDVNGVTQGVSNEIAMAIALKEIYDKSQVMIGEAISVSELNAFIKEKRGALACAIH
jgi:hypothetical protein